MASEDGLVSIIITTYYRNDDLRRVIEHALAQTYDPVEVLVVDDSGERHAEPVVSEYDPVAYLAHDRNRGHIPAWHTGFRAATGEYVQLHDDDDWLAETKIETQVRLLADSDAGVAYCGITYHGVDWDDFRPSYDGDVLKQALGPYHLGQTTTLLVESDLLAEVFPLTDYDGGDDIHLNIELAVLSEFVYVDEPLVHRAITGDSRGRSLEAWEARLRILEDYHDLYDQFHPSLRQELAFKSHLRLARLTWRQHPHRSLAHLASAVRMNLLLGVGYNLSLLRRYARSLVKSYRV